jgi:hypothetical protein
MEEERGSDLTFRVKSPNSPQWPGAGEGADWVGVVMMLEIIALDVVFQYLGVDKYCMLELKGRGGASVVNAIVLVGGPGTTERTEALEPAEELSWVVSILGIDVYRVSNPGTEATEGIIEAAVVEVARVVRIGELSVAA